jgi:hypothetical protein
MEYIESLQKFEARDNVGGDVSQWMPYVEACPRGIGKHVQGIEFGTVRIYRCFKGSLFLPILLPFLLNFPKVVLRHD